MAGYNTYLLKTLATFIKYGVLIFVPINHSISFSSDHYKPMGTSNTP